MSDRGRGAAGLALLLGVLAVLAGGCGTDDVETAELVVAHSRFLPEGLTVEAGTTLRFVVRNDDPIDHELIVGDAEVHERHENGNEASHGDKPGEVSVPAGSERSTTYLFDTPGAVEFACHLPGHLAYGMRGTVTVVP